MKTLSQVDAIIDKNGSTVFAEIQGYVSFFLFIPRIHKLTHTLQVIHAHRLIAW